MPQDDRWGRAFEGYTENPEVAQSYAGPMTLGLQGALSPDHPLTAGHIAGSAKHFLADGGATGGKDQGDFAGTEQELVRTHLSGYPQAIDAGILSIMASFSSWNGVKHTGNETLLTDVLRGPLGFDGFVVSDGLLAPDLQAALFPKESKSILFVGAQLGVGLYMFLVGLGFQRDHFKTNAGSAAAVSLILAKGGACWAAARLTGQDNATALGIGALMNARGLMELIIINIGLQRGIIGPALFSILVLMAIITTLMASPLFEWVYGRKARERGELGQVNEADAAPPARLQPSQL